MNTKFNLKKYIAERQEVFDQREIARLVGMARKKDMGKIILQSKYGLDLDYSEGDADGQYQRGEPKLK